MNYMIEPLKKYAVFSGRARRKEYWMFFLFIMIVSMVIGVVMGLGGSSLEGPTNILLRLFQLAIFLPSIAVGVRRIHDGGKSGWFILIPIYNLILFCIEGNKGENKYGPDPKQT